MKTFQVSLLVSACILATLSLLADGQTLEPKKKRDRCDYEQPTCGICGRKINVTIIATNSLQGDNFELTVPIIREHKRNLLSFLQQAAELENGFKFQATYFANLGYYIDSINGVRASPENKTYWQISSDGVSLQCGVSSYVPKNEDVILFNFTTYQNAGY
ncbi:unnamed protein product [Lymnaea stagnalis]|uniref:Transcobalamin-like C-terminal domain-containing protein n=1 Tax=Lymnaea stagnalis TaxID=6523 RepID=A0AAV2I539_LYMST